MPDIDSPLKTAPSIARAEAGEHLMPVRNEEGNLPRAYDEVTAVMAPLPYDYEVLLIDNDSVDRTGELAAEICQRDARWRYIKFSRNFTVEGSLAAGYRFARGDAAIVLFGDLQDPPSLIADFLRKWEQGYEVVYGMLRRRLGIRSGKRGRRGCCIES